jgi:ferric-dicitrate binding protein FerR (iron transport regulator)
MNCQEAREHLPALVDGELPPPELSAVKQHLELCEECRAEKRRQEQFTTRVKTSLGDLRPSDMFVKGVLDRLEDPAAKSRREAAAVRRARISLLAAGAVILAVLLIATVASLTPARDPDGAGEVTGYTRAWLLQEDASGREARRTLPLHVPPGAGVETEPGGRVLMKLGGGGRIELLEKSRIRLARADGRAPLQLESGGLRLRAAPGAPLEIAAARVLVRADDAAEASVSLQYGRTVVLELASGSATITAGGQARRPEVGEVWIAPADGSGPPARRPAPGEEEKKR